MVLKEKQWLGLWRHRTLVCYGFVVRLLSGKAVNNDAINCPAGHHSPRDRYDMLPIEEKGL